MSYDRSFCRQQFNQIFFEMCGTFLYARFDRSNFPARYWTDNTLPFGSTACSSLINSNSPLTHINFRLITAPHVIKRCLFLRKKILIYVLFHRISAWFIIIHIISPSWCTSEWTKLFKQQFTYSIRYASSSSTTTTSK